jgi:hypothetical protein
MCEENILCGSWMVTTQEYRCGLHYHQYELGWALTSPGPQGLDQMELRSQ